MTDKPAIMNNPYFPMKIATGTWALMMRQPIKPGVVRNERIADRMSERAAKHAADLHNRDYNERKERADAS